MSTYVSAGALTPQEVFESKTRSFPVNFDLLHNHLYRNDSYLHPEQIKFLIKNMLINILEFEEEAMDRWDSLPEETKEDIDNWYKEKMLYRPDDLGRRVDPDIPKKFYEHWNKIYTESHEEAFSKIEE